MKCPSSASRLRRLSINRNEVFFIQVGHSNGNENDSLQDLHRTGCSLFSGEDALPNQALLKRVLLAYARWNKTVGYCQGLNVLAALLLEVMNRCQVEALKVPCLDSIYCLATNGLHSVHRIPDLPTDSYVSCFFTALNHVLSQSKLG